mmetsp:Transcript_45631/g.146441  ORF Transcript_45631/g.146441 Transcript_45631/m.146441 type:complete len:371 (+) Transcript_45631:285-1397(+)
MGAARAAQEQPAFSHHREGQGIQLVVCVQSPAARLLARCHARRVAHHHVEEPAARGGLFQEVEAISDMQAVGCATLRLRALHDLSIKAVQLEVPLTNFDRLGSLVHRGRAGGPAQRRRDGEAARVTEQIQNLLPGGKPSYAPAVLALVQEEAGFVAVGDVRLELGPVLLENRDAGRISLAVHEPEWFPRALPDSAGESKTSRDESSQDRIQLRQPESFASVAVASNNDDTIVSVHDQTRHPVSLPIEQPYSGASLQTLVFSAPVCSLCSDPCGPSLVREFVAPCQEPYSQGRCRVVKPNRDKVLLEHDADHGTRGGLFLHLVQGAVVDPRVLLFAHGLPHVLLQPKFGHRIEEALRPVGKSHRSRGGGKG